MTSSWPVPSTLEAARARDAAPARARADRQTMSTPVEATTGETQTAAREKAKSFLRGSSLLLAGKLLATLINFLVQVLAVRYLTKSDYGSFAWALSIAAMGASIVLLGLNRGVARFASIHHERREYGPLLGTMVLAIGTVAGLGLVVVLLVMGLRNLLAQHVQSELSVGLLVILIALVPLDALDALFETLMAVFARVRAIFFRRYVLGPGLKLLAVLLVMAVGGSPHMLAWAYVVAGLIGVALYVALLRSELAQQGLLDELRSRRMDLPARSLFGFSLPMLTTDLVLAIETPMVVVILEHFRGTLEVAELRAVAPVAALCLFVYQNSKTLFRPSAARFYARGDEAGLGELYWRSAAWMTIVTFPVFATCFFIAEPLTLLLFGDEYAGAGLVLATLAAGKYFNASMGMNTFTLQVHARVRLIVLINIATAVLGLLLALWLVPRYGAVGGAAATTAAIVIRNVMYQAGLIATTRIGLAPITAQRVYASVLGAVALLWAVRFLTSSPLVLVPAIAAAAAFLPWLNRRFLDIAHTFPELARIPLLRRILGVQAS